MKIRSNYSYFRKVVELFKREMELSEFDPKFNEDHHWYDNVVFFADWVVNDGLYGITKDKWSMILISAQFDQADQLMFEEKYGDDIELKDFVTEIITMLFDCCYRVSAKATFGKVAV